MAGKLEVGGLFTVLIAGVEPDDMAFSYLDGETVRVLDVDDAAVSVEVVRGRHHKNGARLSTPIKNAIHFFREPSPEWTPEERLALSARLANRLRAEAQTGRVGSGRVFDVCDRLTLIATMSAEFLELNRKGIMNG